MSADTSLAPWLPRIELAEPAAKDDSSPLVRPLTQLPLSFSETTELDPVRPVTIWRIQKIGRAAKLIEVKPADLPNDADERLQFLMKLVANSKSAIDASEPYRIVAGAAAHHILTNRLYKRLDINWGTFCQNAWGKHRSTIHDWIVTSFKWSLFHANGRGGPSCHSQVLVLLKVTPGRELEVFNTAFDANGGRTPTAAMLHKTAESLGALLPTKHPKPRNKALTGALPTSVAVPEDHTILGSHEAIEYCEDLAAYLESRGETSAAARVRRIQFFIQRSLVPTETVGKIPTVFSASP